jgi:hypothetical protein
MKDIPPFSDVTSPVEKHRVMSNDQLELLAALKRCDYHKVDEYEAFCKVLAERIAELSENDDLTDQEITCIVTTTERKESLQRKIVKIQNESAFLIRALSELGVSRPEIDAIIASESMKSPLSQMSLKAYPHLFSEEDSKQLWLEYCTEVQEKIAQTIPRSKSLVAAKQYDN